MCEMPDGHAGSHVCACGGSWDFDERGLFVHVAQPGTNATYEPVIER